MEDAAKGHRFPLSGKGVRLTAVGGGGSPSLTKTICENFDPFLSLIKWQNNPNHDDDLYDAKARLSEQPVWGRSRSAEPPVPTPMWYLSSYPQKHRHRRNVTSHHFFDYYDYHHKITFISR